MEQYAGLDVSLESTSVCVVEADGRVVRASLPPRTRITPPMGFARSKRVIYGDNRGPFQTGDVRTLR